MIIKLRPGYEEELAVRIQEKKSRSSLDKCRDVFDCSCSSLLNSTALAIQNPGKSKRYNTYLKRIDSLQSNTHFPDFFLRPSFGGGSRAATIAYQFCQRMGSSNTKRRFGVGIDQLDIDSDEFLFHCSFQVRQKFDALDAGVKNVFR